MPINISRFKTKIAYSGKCWNWTGKLGHNGYGRMWIGSRTEYAHRVSWLIYFGSIPEGLYVCHHCDNKGCVNPRHLFVGTAKDNMRDASNKKRIKLPKESYCSDENHQVAKLTNKQVKIIRSGKFKNIELAKKFKVTPTTISYAKTGKTFRDVK